MKLKPAKAGLARHILPASANLLGICFLIFSMTRLQTDWNATVLDECAAVAIVLFFGACLFSYVSLRLEEAQRWENYADICFFLGLVLMAIASVLITLRFLK